MSAAAQPALAKLDASVEERLKFCLALANDWLKFAEAKNGAILALSLGAVGGGLSLLDTFKDGDARVVLILVLLAFASGALVSLCSFLPQLYPSSNGKKDNLHEPNFLFFGHAAAMEPREYIVALRRTLGSDARLETVSEIEVLYADQIVTNSRIARRKFQMFSTAAHCLLLAAAIVLVGGVKEVFF